MRMLKHSLENRICMQYFRVPVYLVPLKYYVKLQMAIAIMILILLVLILHF